MNRADCKYFIKIDILHKFLVNKKFFTFAFPTTHLCARPDVTFVLPVFSKNVHFTGEFTFFTLNTHVAIIIIIVIVNVTTGAEQWRETIQGSHLDANVVEN